MILDTGEKMFKYFLQEIRKTRTIVITPQRWTDFINPVVIDWIKTKLPENEFTQKRIDDLEAIKVLTDGRQYPYIKAFNNISNIFQIPYSSEDHPAYMHGLSAEFGNINSDAVDDGDDDIRGVPNSVVISLNYQVPGKILRADNRVVRKDNPYRQPDDETWMYFENRGGYIYGISKEKEFNRLILEYYSYPDEIKYGDGVDEAGSFKPAQNKEIVDLAVVQYLEVVENPRLQTAIPVKGSIPK